MKNTALLTATLMVFVSLALTARAQESTPPPAPDGQMLDSGQLQQICGPIAAYPDPLVAQLLPAATQPSQIALAYNYVNSGGDPNAIDSQPWDSSVKAIARYPDALKMLNDNLPWTAQLGQAFLNQPADVMNAIQSLRAQAEQVGNLESDPEENVVNDDDGTIEVLPANPDLIYVPVYDPGVFFYRRGFGLSFGVGFGIGAWLNHDFDWHGHNLIVWGRDHPRPGNYWSARPADRREIIARGPVWRPPARVVSRAVVVNRGDRGFVNRDVHTAAIRVAAPAHVDASVRIGGNVSVRANVNVPAPRVSAFVNVGSAAQTRAASSRGVQSRGGGGGGGGRKR